MKRREFLQAMAGGITAGAVAPFLPMPSPPLAKAGVSTRFRLMQILSQYSPVEVRAQFAANNGPVIRQLSAIGFTVHGKDAIRHPKFGVVDVIGS